MELTKKQEEERVYFVYSHVNLVNNKIYIRITKQIPSYRWGSHGQGYKDSPRFWNAIQKYGWDNFEHNILFSELTKDEACKKEIELIKQYNSNDDRYGYNMTSGGEQHYVFNEEVKQKLREQKVGSNNPQWGKHKTEDEKKHLQNIMIKKTKDGNNHAKKVRCKDTGIIYYSCKDAARNTGNKNERQATHIADVCKGLRTKCNGLTWEWIENDINT